MKFVRLAGSTLLALLTSGILVMVIQAISNILYPLPEGLDTTDLEALKKHISTLPGGCPIECSEECDSGLDSGRSEPACRSRQYGDDPSSAAIRGGLCGRIPDLRVLWNPFGSSNLTAWVIDPDSTTEIGRSHAGEPKLNSGVLAASHLAVRDGFRYSELIQSRQMSSV